MTSRFAIAHIDENTDGWGPTTVPDKFKDIPYYAPYNKGDKLGKAADWQQQFTSKGGKYQKDAGGSVSTIFNWYYQDDDSTFQLVDNTKTQKNKYGQKRFQKGMQQKQKQQQNTGWQQQKQQQQQKKGVNRFYQARRWGQSDSSMGKKREPSVQIKEDWVPVEGGEIEFNVLAKVSTDTEPAAEDITSCGTLEYYNKSFDLTSTKTDTMLERTDRTFFNVTTSDDPIIRQLSMEDRANVFATDTILAQIMAATRSVLPWDIVVHKAGSKVFFDKREGSNFDYLTVNETSNEPPVDDPRDQINSSGALMREATFINQNFTQQVLSKAKDAKKVSLAQPNPFQSEGQEVASVGYKYRKWKVSDTISVIARCEIDGIFETKGKDSYLTIKSLNEYDPKMNDWRKKIDSQRGAVLATELRNNAFKIAKWTLQSLLAGTEAIKLGYISRISQKDLTTHQILAVADYRPKEFAQQMNLNLKNAWGILKRIVDLCMKQPNGKYIIIRDPERNCLKLYSVPQDDKPKDTKTEEKQ